MGCAESAMSHSQVLAPMALWFESCLGQNSTGGSARVIRMAGAVYAPRSNMPLGDPGTGPAGRGQPRKGPGIRHPGPAPCGSAARPWPLRLVRGLIPPAFEEALPGSAGPHAVAQVSRQPRRRGGCPESGDSSRALAAHPSGRGDHMPPLVNLTARKRPLLPPSRLCHR